MYLTWAEKTITDFSDANVNSLYNEGYLFTRTGKGVMNQTCSVRIDLNKFKLSSENRRILKKTENLLVTGYQLPARLASESVAGRPVTNYHWSIGKMAKDFYETKFGPKIFSANKIKELLTKEHNFNRLFCYGFLPLERGGQEGLMNKSTTPTPLLSKEGKQVGYAICFETNELLHYSYPFYDLKAISYKLIPNLGLGMMLKAILYAQENGKKYIYLGSAQRPTDTYKLQFEGLEWFDGKKWEQDIEALKQILNPKS